MRKRIPELDGIRGLAILLVISYHYVFGGISEDNQAILAVSIRHLFSLAWSGVDLFFVLSGFLIGGILIDQRHTENYFKAFFLRRTMRIFPLYFLWLTLFLILQFLTSQRFHQPWFRQLFDQQGIPTWTYFLFLQNFPVAENMLPGSIWMGATWSLAVEEQFYLLMPFIIWLIPPKKLQYWLLLMILLVPLFRVYLYLYHPNLFRYVLLPCHADALLLGVFCAWLLRNESSRNWLQTNQTRLRQMFAILLCGVIYLATITKGRHIFYVDSLFEMTSWGYTWLAIFYACLLLLITTGGNGTIAYIARLSILRNLGIIAYGVYVIHMAMNSVAHGLIGKDQIIKNYLDALVTFMALIATIFIARFSWRFFEKPIIDWGHSLSYAGKHRPPK